MRFRQYGIGRGGNEFGVPDVGVALLARARAPDLSPLQERGGVPADRRLPYLGRFSELIGRRLARIPDCGEDAAALLVGLRGIRVPARLVAVFGESGD
jgi:hypothetical protein